MQVGYFLGPGKQSFSAATIYLGRYKRAIILNPAHANTRQGNSLCHEVSHIVLEHEAEAPLSEGGRRGWNPRQEREADWLAGCLLIPGDAARAAGIEGHSDAEVAATFGVSVALATWRMRMTGARVVASRWQRLRQAR